MSKYNNKNIGGIEMKECKILLIDPFCKNPKYESPNAKLGYTSAILEKKDMKQKY